MRFACVVRYLLGNELLLHLYVVVWKPWNGGRATGKSLGEEPWNGIIWGFDLEVNRRLKVLFFKHIFNMNVRYNQFQEILR